jgi:photosystem II stability/assembly factor-like uncharacterized protein
MMNLSFFLKKRPKIARKRVVFGLFFVLICFSFPFISCKKKEKITLSDFVELPKIVSKELTSVAFLDEKKGFIVGGDTWFRGEIFATKDGGDTWNLDTVVGQKLTDISFDSFGEAYSVGVGGRLFTLKSGENRWFKAREDFLFPRSCSFLNENQGLIASGEGFINGKMQRLGPIWSDSRDTFSQELAAVQWVDSSIAVASGYGLVIRSTDAGFSWKRLDFEGDFFVALHFPTEKVGYVVGEFGTILKTTDAGENWKKIRSGGRAFDKTARFQSVRFANENDGFVVGDNGLFWKTSDGGDSWQIVENAPSDLGFADIFIKNKTGWAISTDGRVFRFGF